MKKKIIVAIATILLSTNTFAQVTESTAFVQRDKIVWMDLEKQKEECLEDKGNFFYPVIAPDGERVAYLKNRMLTVSKIVDKKRKIVQIEKGDNLSYIWLDENRLLYSTKKGEVKQFDVEKEKMSTLIQSDAVYTNLTKGKDNKIYAQKYKEYQKDGDSFVENIGIIEYDLATKQERIIIVDEKADWDNQNPGMWPTIAGISPDNKYLYIWRKYHSGSYNTDGVPFGIYDIEKETFQKIDKDTIYAVASPYNIAISPKEDGKVIINNGGLREVNKNKVIGLLDSATGKYETLLPDTIAKVALPYAYEAKGMVTMTPSFSQDGKKVYYSASRASEESELKWISKTHPIYSIELETRNIHAMTHPKNAFDLYPREMANGKDIIFVRRTEGQKHVNYALYRQKNGKEVLLSDKLAVLEDDFFNIRQIVDLHLTK